MTLLEALSVIQSLVAVRVREWEVLLLMIGPTRPDTVMVRVCLGDKRTVEASKVGANAGAATCNVKLISPMLSLFLSSNST